MGRDAFGLADDLRLGAVKRKVYKERGRFGALGYRARGYRWPRDDVARVKNRLKSVYRSRGVQLAGSSVYTASKRGEFLGRLPRATQPLAFNHTLKAIFKGAAKTVIGRARNEPIHRHHLGLVDGGTKPNLAN